MKFKKPLHSNFISTIKNKSIGKPKRLGINLIISGRFGGALKTRKRKLTLKGYKPQNFNVKMEKKLGRINTKWGIFGITLNSGIKQKTI